MAARLIARSSIAISSPLLLTPLVLPFQYHIIALCRPQRHRNTQVWMVAHLASPFSIYLLAFRLLDRRVSAVSSLSLMLYFHLLGLSTMRGNNREIDVYVDTPRRPPTRSHDKASSRHFYARVTLLYRCVPLRFDTLRYFAATSIYPH